MNERGVPPSQPSAPADYRIVLVHPSKRGCVRSLFTFHKDEGLGAKPPLAILSLATSLRAKGFAGAVCLDAAVDNLSPEETVERLAALRPDLVGLTVWTDFWHPAWRTMELARRRLPDARIVVGGPHCLAYPEDVLRSSQADFLVCGDGEDAIVELAERLRRGEPAPDAAGLWRKVGGAVLRPSVPVAVLADLAGLPIPDRRLLPPRRYGSVLSAGVYETTMVTSRGCPYRCVFCRMNAQKVYARPAAEVVREFREIAELGITDVQVYDDTFTWSRERVREICEGILDARLKVRWAVRDRVSQADEGMFRLMKRAGCHRVHFGVESGSPEILKASGKDITLDEVLRAVETARRAGLVSMAYFMFGFLDETREDALRTIRFAHELNADYSVFAVLIPYPGTRIYEEALGRGIIPRDYWLEFTRRPVPDFVIPRLIEQHLDRAALIRLKDRALAESYLNLPRILREVRRVRSWREFRDKGRMGLAIAADALRSSLGWG